MICNEWFQKALIHEDKAGKRSKSNLCVSDSSVIFRLSVRIGQNHEEYRWCKMTFYIEHDAVMEDVSVQFSTSVLYYFHWIFVFFRKFSKLKSRDGQTLNWPFSVTRTACLMIFRTTWRPFNSPNWGDNFSITPNCILRRHKRLILGKWPVFLHSL